MRAVLAQIRVERVLGLKKPQRTPFSMSTIENEFFLDGYGKSDTAMGKVTQRASLSLTKEEAIELLQTGYVKIDDLGDRGVIEVRAEPEADKIPEDKPSIMARLKGKNMKVKVIKAGQAAKFIMPQVTDGQARAGDGNTLLTGEGEATNTTTYDER